MVKYICLRCNYYTNHKASFKNHLNRKNICHPINQNVSYQSIKEFYQLDGIITTLPHTITPGQYICNYCQKCFTRKYGLNKHHSICKIKKTHLEEKNELKQSIETLLSELNSVKTTINNITNTTNNYQNNNVVVLNFGNENIDHINKKYLTNLIKGAFGAIPKLVETIHFDPKHPENHNIKITNTKLPYAHVMNNNKWEIRNKEDILDDLVDNKYTILDNHYEENFIKNELSDFSKNVIEKFITKYETGDKEFIKTIKKKIEMVILNNSKIIS